MPSLVQSISPLRYPGSKALLTGYLSSVIEDNNLVGSTIVEPYAGSAIVSIMMLMDGYAENAIIVERDPLIYSFWYAVFNQPIELVNRIQDLPITLDTWGHFRQYRTVDDLDTFDVMDLATAGLFFNRTNFSGILKAGPIGGKTQEKNKIDCRFNKVTILKQIENLAHLGNRIEVVFDDALHFLENRKSIFEQGNYFVYIDPPYFEEGKKLYRYWYQTEDHIMLANFLDGFTAPWLVSYDDHPTIRDIYSNTNSRLQQIFFDYAARNPKRVPELLISNREIPPIHYEQGMIFYPNLEAN